MIQKEVNNNISIVKTGSTYPDFPYSKGTELHNALKNLLMGLGLSPSNPFGEYIKPGQTALIKPNWARDFNPLGHSIDSLISHSSLIKYLIDFLAVAMEGRGRIIIADAPLQNCNFENLKKENRILEVVKNALTEYPQLDIVVEDWRITTMDVSKHSTDAQDVRLKENEYGTEYKVVDIGSESFLEDISELAGRFRVTKYKPSLMKKHHGQGKHEYLVTSRIFEADFFINLPKFKTHIKAGLTCAMKNLVGINGHKEFLPHHIKGSPVTGGDNYKQYSWLKARYEDLYDYVWENLNTFHPYNRKILLKILEYVWLVSERLGGDRISAGSWSGNNTIWRTTLDLNHIAYFNEDKPLRILNIVDGIIAGEGQGPLEPTPRPFGMLIASENPAYIDAVVAQMMGFEVENIPTVFQAINSKKSKFSKGSLSDISIAYTESNNTKTIYFSEIKNYKFIKPKFWD